MAGSAGQTVRAGLAGAAAAAGMEVAMVRRGTRARHDNYGPLLILAAQNFSAGVAAARRCARGRQHRRRAPASEGRVVKLNQPILSPVMALQRAKGELAHELRGTKLPRVCFRGRYRLVSSSRSTPSCEVTTM